MGAPQERGRLAGAAQQLKNRFVGAVYARHNRSRSVQEGLREAFAELDSGGIGLDLGSGANRLHPRLLRLDLDPAAGPDCRAAAERLPFRDNSLKVIVSQETLEHVADPWGALREAARALEPGGLLYLQTPFVIGHHSGPRDYWRFTHEGLKRIIEDAGLTAVRIRPAVGAGTALYRISVEFIAVTASTIARRLYLPAKALAALVCAPLRLADWATTRGAQAHRIPGGFLALARKPS